MVADVPAPLMAIELTLTPAGAIENIDPLRFIPVTTRVAVMLGTMYFGVTERMIGTGRIVKALVDVALDAPTITEIDPVVAPSGTVTTRVVAVAEITVAAAPLKRIALADGIGLNPWP